MLLKYIKNVLDIFGAQFGYLLSFMSIKRTVLSHREKRTSLQSVSSIVSTGSLRNHQGTRDRKNSEI